MKCKKRKKGKHAVNYGVNLPGDYPWIVLRELADDLRHLLTERQAERLRAVIRARDLEGYFHLSEVWGLQSINLGGMSLAQARGLYQLAALMKKFQFETNLEDRVATAKRKFLDAEESCARYNHGGYNGLFESGPGGLVLRPVFRQARAFLIRLLGDQLPGSKHMLNWSRHGPGANLDTKRGLTSIYNKFGQWPYSCTVDAYRYARFLIETDQRWFGALQDSYREHFGIPKQMPLDMTLFWSRVIRIVKGNRIGFVPKDAKTQRSIAIEPCLNLMLQLGADGFIRQRLKRFGIDIDSQEENQEKARLGSLDDSDDSFVTLDLSAASDSISLKLCEALLPEDWFTYLCDIRSPQGVMDKEVISYEKISSMGNGVTFALETAIFASICYGVMKVVEGRYNRHDLAVFGDDIIVRKRLVGKVVRSLAIAGFKVNTEKSFLFGRVRESCGTDWFEGKPLRPVMLKCQPTSVMGLFVDFNRLRRLLSLRWGVDECDSRVLKRMARWIPKGFEDLRGPCSDHLFDTYRHSESRPERGSTWRVGLYRFRHLLVKPRPIKGHNFLFRKLMHDLRSCPVLPSLWCSPEYKGCRISGSGGRFMITSPKRCIVGYTYSVTDIWCTSYSEVTVSGQAYEIAWPDQVVPL